jgi:hypothetical protein
VVGLGISAELGQLIGARYTLLLATLGMLLGPLWLTLERIQPEQTYVEAENEQGEPPAPNATLPEPAGKLSAP